MGAITTDGIMAAKVTMPAALDVPVSFNASAARATINAHAEDWENTVAPHRRRNSAYRSGSSIRETKVSFVTVLAVRPRTWSRFYSPPLQNARSNAPIFPLPNHDPGAIIVYNPPALNPITPHIRRC